MHKRTVTEPSRVRTYQRQQLRCGKCDRLIDTELEVDIDIMEFVKAMKAIRCPHCGSKKILLGQNRSLVEDRAYPSTGDVEQRMAFWLENGEMGTSSEAIRLHMIGRPKGSMDAPRDAADLRRCVLLLHRIPEWRDRMGEMAVHPKWQRLAPEWGRLEALFVEDVGEGLERVPAPKANEALQALID